MRTDEARWLRLEPQPGETLRSALERTLRDAIRGGVLRPGVRLPSSRALAAQLGISRGVASDAYEQLAMAYGRKGDIADADLASAQAAFARGDNKTARELAARAKMRFPIGSPGWVRADDIVAFNKNLKQNPLRAGP